eukprot:m.147507 g.147507  ORF g.147507 m.147507 type:complete len:412 (+) comp14184_c0_seq1:188-1423(+)
MPSFAQLGASVAHQRVCEIRERLEQHRARHTEALQQIEAATRVRDQMEAEMAAAEAELEAAVQAPVPSGEDPTRWLPDELVITIMLWVGWSRSVMRVCQRWRALLTTPVVRRQLLRSRWEGYAHGRFKPKSVAVGPGVLSIAVSQSGQRYIGTKDGLIHVWDDGKSAPDRTLSGHSAVVRALALGPDGTVFSGSYDSTVRVWSGEDGHPIRTLKGHSSYVVALAIDGQGVLYSGSSDKTIRVWSCESGICLSTLEGHKKGVRALAVGLEGQLFSASNDRTIRVWVDCEHTRTLTGHTDAVTCLAIGEDRTLLSGSTDTTVRVWSSADLTLLRTLHTESRVWTVAVGACGRVFSGLEDGDVRMDASDGQSLTICSFGSCTRALVFGPNGPLYAGFSSWYGSESEQVHTLCTF